MAAAEWTTGQLLAESGNNVRPPPPLLPLLLLPEPKVIKTARAQPREKI
jgi:hypothetical protein